MPKSPYQKVADDIRAKIRAGDYPPGLQLPSRRDLQDAYGVSDSVINSAMRILRQENLIETEAGVGVYVADPLPAPPAQP